MSYSRVSTLFVSFMLLISAGCKERPHLNVPELIELGELDPFAIEPIVIPIQNPGNEDVNVKDVQTTCGCLVVTDTSFTVRKNQQSNLKIVATVLPDDVEFNQTVIIQTEYAKYSLRLHATIDPGIRLARKRMIFLGERLPPESLYAEATFDLEDAEISVSSPVRFLSFSFERQGDRGLIIGAVPGEDELCPSGSLNIPVLVEAISPSRKASRKFYVGGYFKHCDGSAGSLDPVMYFGRSGIENQTVDLSRFNIASSGAEVEMIFGADFSGKYNYNIVGDQLQVELSGRRLSSNHTGAMVVSSLSSDHKRSVIIPFLFSNQLP